MRREILLTADIKEETTGPSVQDAGVPNVDYESKKLDTKANKAKKEAGIKLSADAREERLGGNHAIPSTVLEMGRDILHTYVTRLFISHNYGGSPQGMVPSINRQKFSHDMTFIFYKLDFNPEAPTAPGTSGLVFDARGPTDEELQEEVPGREFDPATEKYDPHWDPNASPDEMPKQRAFVGLGPNQWVHLGFYRYYRRRSLTPQEFKGLDKKVRETWCRDLATKDPHNGVRLRISLRKKLGRYVSWDEVEKELAQLDKNDKVLLVTEEEVDKAFADGDERIGVCLMKCIGYDKDFQEGIVKRWAEWQNGKGNLKPDIAETKKGVKKVKKAGEGQKRKLKRENTEVSPQREQKRRKVNDESEDSDFVDALPAANLPKRHTRSMTGKKEIRRYHL